MQIAARDHGRAKERHADHNEDLNLVGAEQRDAENIAPDDVTEVEYDRADEGECERDLDNARNAVESLVDHGCPEPEITSPLAGRGSDVISDKLCGAPTAVYYTAILSLRPSARITFSTVANSGFPSGESAL